MPNANQHKFKFKHNENFYLDIRNNLNNYVDWQITSLYYSVLHLINAYAKKYHSFEKINSPELLTDFVDIHFHKFLGKFEDLKDLCWQARYTDCTDCSNREQQLLQIYKPFFDTFKNLVENQL